MIYITFVIKIPELPTIDLPGSKIILQLFFFKNFSTSLEYLLKEDPQILNLNIGTGIGTSVLELVETFKKVNKCDIPYEYCDRRSGDVANVVADNKKAIEILDWEPKKNIEDMCRDGWKWQKDNLNGYKS